MTFVTSHATRRLMLDYREMNEACGEALRAYRRAQEARRLFIESLLHLRWLRGRVLRRDVRGVP